jgi:guanyl-specific ribonuclease Sa
MQAEQHGGKDNASTSPVGKAAPQRRRQLPFKDADYCTAVNATLDSIESGGPFLHKRDGMDCKNREGKLPAGAYREYTVSTPGALTRGYGVSYGTTIWGERSIRTITTTRLLKLIQGRTDALYQ